MSTRQKFPKQKRELYLKALLKAVVTILERVHKEISKGELSTTKIIQFSLMFLLIPSYFKNRYIWHRAKQIRAKRSTTKPTI